MRRSACLIIICTSYFTQVIYVNFFTQDIESVVFLCAHNLTTYKIIIGKHCGVILIAKF